MYLPDLDAPGLRNFDPPGPDLGAARLAASPFRGGKADLFLARMMAALIICGFCLGGPQSADAQSIDPCLVGAWEAMSFTLTDDPRPTGGSGFRVTFTADGAETVDYSTMKPIIWPPRTYADTQIWRGSANFQISTDQNFAKLESIVRNSVEVKPTELMQDFMVGWPGRLGPGALGSTKNGESYVCTDGSLEYATTDDGGKPWVSTKLARLNETATPALPAPEPPVAVNGQTWLTPTEIKDRPQDLEGVWSEEGVDPPLWWLANEPPDTLEDHPMPSRDPNKASI